MLFRFDKLYAIALVWAQNKKGLSIEKHGGDIIVAGMNTDSNCAETTQYRGNSLW